MSQLIYKSPIQTARGPAEVRITDTAPSPQTPSLSERPALGGIELKMGDEGSTAQGFPTTLGSSFELRIPDPRYHFQDLFLAVFDDRRFEVELEIPQTGTWKGYVKSTLQTRRASRKTAKGITTIKCFDGIALLGEDSTAINARATDVLTFLEEAFAVANPDLPILFYSDLKATTIEGSDIGFASLRPIAKNARSYEPPEPNGPSGEQLEDGIEGDTLREQLDTLAEKITAVAYQDIRQGAWAFIDVAAVGANVTGKRYNGGDWSSYTLPEQTLYIDAQAVALEDEQEALKTEESVRAVCINLRNWLTDPGFEASLNGTDLEFWKQTQVERNSDGYLIDTSSDSSTVEGVQVVDFSEVDIYGRVDVFRLLVTDTRNHVLEFKITYGNGDTSTARRNVADDRLYSEIDPDGGHSEVESVRVSLNPNSSDPLQTASFELLQKLTNNAVSSAGTNNKYRVVDTVCYKASDESGRSTIEPEAGGLLTVLADNSESPVEKWKSSRYDSSPYDRLGRWRAVNLLSLRPPPYERLRTSLIGEWVPLGTRLKMEKPDEDRQNVFIPLKGRTLTISQSRAETSLEDVELPRAVTDKI